MSVVTPGPGLPPVTTVTKRSCHLLLALAEHQSWKLGDHFSSLHAVRWLWSLSPTLGTWLAMIQLCCYKDLERLSQTFLALLPQPFSGPLLLPFSWDTRLEVFAPLTASGSPLSLSHLSWDFLSLWSTAILDNLWCLGNRVPP